MNKSVTKFFGWYSRDGNFPVPGEENAGAIIDPSHVLIGTLHCCEQYGKTARSLRPPSLMWTGDEAIPALVSGGEIDLERGTLAFPHRFDNQLGLAGVTKFEAKFVGELGVWIGTFEGSLGSGIFRAIVDENFPETACVFGPGAGRLAMFMEEFGGTFPEAFYDSTETPGLTT